MQHPDDESWITFKVFEQFLYNIQICLIFVFADVLKF